MSLCAVVCYAAAHSVVFVVVSVVCVCVVAVGGVFVAVAGWL